MAPQTIYLVLASDLYDELDYIRNYEEFTNLLMKAPQPDHRS
jgi:hypothetical protein